MFTPEMVSTRLMTILNSQPLSALGQLMLGYAHGAEQRHLHHRCWALDARLADLVRKGREPAIATIRLAWWRDALAGEDLSKGQGDPLIEAWRMAGVSAIERDFISRLITGWGALLEQESLSAEALLRFADHRGHGFFGLLAGARSEEEGRGFGAAGALWALWDLAGHVQDVEDASLCLDLAVRYQPLPQINAGSSARVVRLLTLLANSDVAARRFPRGGFELRHYFKLLLRGPFA